MILLLSRAQGETTTDAVSNWLERLGAEFVRLNAEDLEYPARFSYSPLGRRELRLADRTIALADVRVVWYRRWSSFEQYHRAHVDHLFDDDARQHDVMQYLATELRAVGEAVFAGLRHAHWLSDAASSKLDKTRVSSVAGEVGLEIPDTIIATTRAALLEFQARHGRVITKSLSGRPFRAHLERSDAASYTTEPTAALLAAGPEVFFPSLLQEHIDKAYEIRTFVLGDSVSSMAIFSQSDAQTTLDFRRYNDARPNRCVPYELPGDVQAKLLELMRALGLDTGSADLIRTVDGRYVFLEINPIGQFGMVSLPCNYYLEKRVASYLIHHAENR